MIEDAASVSEAPEVDKMAEVQALYGEYRRIAASAEQTILKRMALAAAEQARVDVRRYSTTVWNGIGSGSR